MKSEIRLLEYESLVYHLLGLYPRNGYTFYNFSSLGFPDCSVGEESACNAGDPSSISGSGRSTGGGIDYPLQYTRASLVVQMVKNSPAMRETWVRFPRSVRSPGGRRGNPLQYPCLENSGDSGAWPATVHGVTETRTGLSN